VERQQHTTTYYNVYGLRLAVSTHDPHIEAAFHARLKQWAVPSDSSPQLRFDFYCIDDIAQSGLRSKDGRMRVVYEPRAGGEVLYDEEEDKLYIHWQEHIRLICSLTQGDVRVFYTPSASDNLWLLSHALFMLSLVELLKRRGHYSLHAAGLCINGNGLLLPGSSGSGKTTLAIALLRAGFGFLGDDTVFLTPEPEGLQVLAFPDEIDVTDNTIHLFPELHKFLQMPLVSGSPKRQVRAETVYEVNFVSACRPAVLVFPRVANVARSTLKPMGRDEAFLELTPNILLTNPRASQAHLDVLAALVRQCDCYRLETGRDFDTLPDRLRELLGA